LAIEQQPQQHRGWQQQQLPAVVSAAAGGRDTLQPAADATWQPKMNYDRFRIPIAMRCCTC